MPIERFVWTDHALQRLQERGLTAFEVEEAIREGHEGREQNADAADWLISAKTQSGISIEAVYDHPHAGDEATARVVSVWRLADETR
jgi:predicted fused transcriptional regulator/phosphomethylpyrimidine kinase